MLRTRITCQGAALLPSRAFQFSSSDEYFCTYFFNCKKKPSVRLVHNSEKPNPSLPTYTIYLLLWIFCGTFFVIFFVIFKGFLWKIVSYSIYLVEEKGTITFIGCGIKSVEKYVCSFEWSQKEVLNSIRCNIDFEKSPFARFPRINLIFL